MSERMRDRELPSLLHLVDAQDGLRTAMEFDVVYSLEDRECQRCLEGRRDVPGTSVALVKVRHAGHPLGHLITLCEEHATSWSASPVVHS
ncbi:hypothetical protein [Arsenicicoccus dermatophilus]|uniref:hypothetical protein n=1 Tax=Arsenicicoccus dermatophilus TaxID=1076331 RepID=UPI0039173504